MADIGEVSQVLVEPAIGVDPEARVSQVLVEPAIGDADLVRVALCVVEVFCTLPVAYTPEQKKVPMQYVQGNKIRKL